MHEAEAATNAPLPAAATGLTLFHSSFTFGGRTFPFTMIGTNPASGSATTTIPTVLVPLRFQFADGTVIDPNAVLVNGTGTAVQNTLLSPLFQQATFTAGTVSLGTTQYIDAFQRANFFHDIATVSPGYHLDFGQPMVLATETIVVPAGSGTTVAGPNGVRVGHVSLSFFHRQLSAIVTRLRGMVTPADFLIFLTHNVFFTSGGCCVTGFHTAFGSNIATAQVVAVAAYPDAGIFRSGTQDVSTLSHELGEAVDDPSGNNIVPAWGHVGQVSGCQNNLEVGDGFKGIFTVDLNGHIYHLQDLTFLSWFARQVPSTAVNGWFSFLNEPKTVPPVCH
jgi:hypothetical protein